MQKGEPQMIGRRTVVGLSLLCALMVSALAVQSASAASAVNTTATTCKKVEVPKTGAFDDEHCNIENASGKGEYIHGTPWKGTTETEASNEAGKNAVLKGELGGVKMEITCTSVTDEKGTLTNQEVGKEHKLSGSTTVNFAGVCTVAKPAKCTVKTPITTKAVFEGVEGLGAGKNEMGVEFKPSAGEIFTTITLEGAECALKGKPLEVKGTAIGTGAPAATAKQAGSTLVFTNAMTKETLSIGGKAAEFESTTTVRMKGKEGPIALTTTT
jgi:hypothetical protein